MDRKVYTLDVAPSLIHFYAWFTHGLYIVCVPVRNVITPAMEAHQYTPTLTKSRDSLQTISITFIKLVLFALREVMTSFSHCTYRHT